MTSAKRTSLPTAAQQISARILLEQQDALATLGGYVDYMHPSGLPDFQYGHAPHHALIAGHLERLARERFAG